MRWTFFVISRYLGCYRHKLLLRTRTVDRSPDPVFEFLSDLPTLLHTRFRTRVYCSHNLHDHSLLHFLHEERLPDEECGGYSMRMLVSKQMQLT